MTYYWLIIALPWIGPARPQYISNGGPGANDVNNGNKLQYTMTNSDYLNPHNGKNAYSKVSADLETQPVLIENSSNFPIPAIDESKGQANENFNWSPQILNTERMVYLRSDGQMSVIPYVIQRIQEYNGISEKPVKDDYRQFEKKSFSPWGGKRDALGYTEDMWTWKRSANMREPNMPKRVRFSPWGGKRSSSVLVKSGVRGSRIIFMNSFPEITRILAALKAKEAIPMLEKRRPVKIWTLSSKSEDSIFKDKWPARLYIDFNRPGNPYTEKRKVKFSAWGGKRAPPVIGPIWNPLNHVLRDDTVDKIISESNTDETTKAF